MDSAAFGLAMANNDPHAFTPEPPLQKPFAKSGEIRGGGAVGVAGSS